MPHRAPCTPCFPLGHFRDGHFRDGHFPQVKNVGRPQGQKQYVTFVGDRGLTPFPTAFEHYKRLRPKEAPRRAQNDRPPEINTGTAHDMIAYLLTREQKVVESGTIRTAAVYPRVPGICYSIRGTWYKAGWSCTLPHCSRGKNNVGVLRIIRNRSEEGPVLLLCDILQRWRESTA